jgi:hypothetical protein
MSSFFVFCIFKLEFSAVKITYLLELFETVTCSEKDSTRLPVKVTLRKNCN